MDASSAISERGLVMDKLYTAKEVAEMMQIHIQTVYRLGRERKLKTLKVGRSVRFLMPGKDDTQDVKQG